MIRKDLKEFIKTIPSNVTLVAATKYVDELDMMDLFNAGITNFGENRVDSFIRKYYNLINLKPTWHFIGHLQTNKAKDVINKIDFLHSLDSVKLAQMISKYRETPLKCFVEISLNNEESKNGIQIEKTEEFLNQIINLPNVEIVGFMGMSRAESSHEQLIEQFNKLISLRDNLEKIFRRKFPYLSMGMSGDYLEAIECGSTHIRLGRILFK